MSLVEDIAKQWRHAVFVCYVVIIVNLFLLPLPSIPLAESKHVDKLVHFGIFLGFVLLFYLDRHRKVWWTFLIGTAFAGGIELVQSILPYREGDLLDFLAGVAGAGLGAGLLLLMARPAGGVASTSAQSSDDL